MKKSTVVILGLAVVVVSIAAGILWFRQYRRQSSPSILLITLDTTRADRIGAYGYKNARTPALDGLAKDGVLFERAISPAPLTLPVHASLFTGLYPPEHGLRTNGYGKLPETLNTLPRILADEGYDTGAFVASFVLDQKFGLKEGFQEYDDDLSKAAPTQDAIHRFRDGRLVVDSALEWLKQPHENPFFCWVHLYDPHFPYEPHAAEFGDDFADSLYDGEIAYADQQVARLLEFLKAHPNTVVVVVGDHGESLGEHSELQHGYTLYDSTQHVPLIVKGVPGAVPGTRVASTVSLVDLLPTLTELLGISTPSEISGRSFLSGLKGQSIESRVVYGGTDDPFLQNRWSPLRSLTTDDWRYIRTTRPELYDLKADPQELKNLAGDDPERVLEFEQQLGDLESSLISGEAGEVQLSDAEQKALSSLGYVGGASREAIPAENNLPDVKDMLPFNAATQVGIDLLDKGQLAEAEQVLRKVVTESPAEHLSSRLYLGAALERLGRAPEAEAIYKSALEVRPDDFGTHFHLGTLYADQGQLEQAMVAFEKCIELEPEATEPLFNLGLARFKAGDTDSAARLYQAVLQIDPMFPGAWVALGTLRSQEGRSTEAISAYQSELKINPESIEANVNLGVQLGSEQRFEESRQYLTTAVKLAPERVDALFNLGVCEEMLKNYAEAEKHLREAVRLQPEATPLKVALGNVLVKAGNSAEAIKVFEQAVAETPDNVNALFSLAKLHVAAGNKQSAIDSLEQLLRVQPGNAQAAAELQRIRSEK